MKKRHYTKVFQKSSELLKEMLELVEQGYSYNWIGKKFRVHHTTIMFHAKKNMISNGKVMHNRFDVSLTCAFCGKSFLSKKTQRFCSKSCVSKYTVQRQKLKEKDNKWQMIDGEKVNMGLETYEDYVLAEKERQKKRENLISLKSQGSVSG